MSALQLAIQARHRHQYRWDRSTRHRLVRFLVTRRFLTRGLFLMIDVGLSGSYKMLRDRNRYRNWACFRRFSFSPPRWLSCFSVIRLDPDIADAINGRNSYSRMDYKNAPGNHYSSISRYVRIEMRLGEYQGNGKEFKIRKSVQVWARLPLNPVLK